MVYRILAEIVLVLHLCFVVFVVFGGLLALRRRNVAWLHLPAVIWGVLIEWFWWTCPLTALENQLRQAGGTAGYATGFIDYYVSIVLYAPLSPQLRIAFGLLLVGFNLIVYSYLCGDISGRAERFGEFINGNASITETHLALRLRRIFGLFESFKTLYNFDGKHKFQVKNFK